MPPSPERASPGASPAAELNGRVSANHTSCIELARLFRVRKRVDPHESGCQVIGDAGQPSLPPHTADSALLQQPLRPSRAGLIDSASFAFGGKPLEQAIVTTIRGNGGVDSQRRNTVRHDARRSCLPEQEKGFRFLDALWVTGRSISCCPSGRIFAPAKTADIFGDMSNDFSRQDWAVAR